MVGVYSIYYHIFSKTANEKQGHGISLFSLPHSGGYGSSKVMGGGSTKKLGVRHKPYPLLLSIINFGVTFPGATGHPALAGRLQFWADRFAALADRELFPARRPMEQLFCLAAHFYRQSRYCGAAAVRAAGA